MVTAAKPAPKRRRREETRQRLLDAALSIFARHGYERATVDEIVGEAGFSKGAFYVHFESKEDLFWSKLEHRIANNQATFREAVDPSRPVAENLAAIIRAAFNRNQREPLWGALFMEFAAHASRNPRVRDNLAEVYHSWRRLTIETLRLGQKIGVVRQDIDVELFASVLISVVEGTIIQARIAPDTVNPEETIEPLSHLLADWIEAR